jgi:hypothetical protein
MLDNFCQPARVYLILASFSLVIITASNLGKDTQYCIGELGCYAENSIYLLIFRVLYILFWTVVLNLICRGGGSLFSWILVLIPFILYFFIIGMAFTS